MRKPKIQQRTERRISAALRLVLVAVLLLAQIALGAWVSTNYAVVACMSWPLCQGQLLPPADYAGGFTLWRELHRDAAGGGISFAALLGIHLVHRWFAVLAAAALAALACGTAPSAARGWALSASRFQTCTVYPAWHSRRAMGNPMRPVPSMAMSMFAPFYIAVSALWVGAGGHFLYESKSPPRVVGARS